MSSVFITDGEQRAALAAARSLGRAGHTVYVGSTRKSSLAGTSRFAREQFLLPNPLTTPHEFTESVRRIVDQRRVEVLLPISEAALLALLPKRSAYPEVVIPFPGADNFRQICDKSLVADRAEALGIGVPKQIRLTAKSDLDTIDLAALRFPMVVKSTRSVVIAGEKHLKTGVAYVEDGKSLRVLVESQPGEVFPLLLQERIRGPGIGVFLLLWNGQLLASFAHRRIREKPPSGGVSVYRESAPLDRVLLARSRELVEQFDWQGVAMVEYKVAEETGEPYLMEINGRLWGSLQLAIDAGVDFPALLVAAACGERVEPVRSYRIGVRSRWWWGDLDHLLTILRRSRSDLFLPDNAPGRAETLFRFLSTSVSRARNEVLRINDPAPAIREAFDWLRGR